MNKEFQTLRKKQRFGLRKLNIGVASVLLGFTIFGYNLASQAPVAHATTGTVTTASTGSGASGSPATGGASGSQTSNSQSSEPANSDNAPSSTANQPGTVSANQNSNTSAAGAPASSDPTVTVDETTLPATQAAIPSTNLARLTNFKVGTRQRHSAMLLTNLAMLPNSGTDTPLPTTTQTYDKVEQPLLYDYGLHVDVKGKRDGNTWVNKNLYWYRDSTLDTIFGGNSKPGIITSHPDKYFFAAYVDYSEKRYHRVILLARGQDPSDKNLYSYTIHTASKNTSTTTTKPGESIKEQYTGTGGSTYDLIFKNYGDSFTVKLNGFEGGPGLLPVFDGGLLDPTYGSNTYDQNHAAAQAKSIGFWASAIPQETSTKVRYVDQATGKDIVQPMEISGFGYQGFKIKGDAPTVEGYKLVSKPTFLPSTYAASAYEDGTISPYKVGQTYDLALSDSVVIKQTVIDTDGTVRATAYYKGSRLPSTDASKVLGHNYSMSFFDPDGKSHTYTNRIGQVDDSYIYYYAKESDPNGSEMRLHFIDVTGVNNSSYAPSDGPELDVDKVQTIHGNIGENYNFTYTVPKGYDQVATSDVTGTYSKTHHDAYVYVKKQAENKLYAPVAGDPLTVEQGTKLTTEQAKAAVKYNGDVPSDATYAWDPKTPVDTATVGSYTPKVIVTYGDGTTSSVTVTVNVVAKTDKSKYTVAAGQPVTLTHGKQVQKGDSLDSSAVTLTDAKGQPVSLPDGAKVVWTTAPDTREVGNGKTGQAKVVYGDQSESEPVTVTYNVTKNDADQYTPEVSTPTVDQNAEVDPNSVVTNKDKLPKGTTYSWTTKPNTETAGQPATGSLHVAYPDGSSKDVPVTVNVKSNADQYTPEVSTPTVDQNAEVDPNSVVTNKDKLPKGTTYSWTTKPNTETAGQPATGSLHVAYPDGSSKDVPVTVNVKSNADQYTPEVSTPTVDQNAEVDPNSVVTNKDKLPKGTTYSWTTKPNTETAGQPATGSLHVAYPDGSSKDVPVTVNVKSNADQYTPEVSTPTVDQNAEVDPNSVVTNKDKLPKGTTYSWTTKPNTETAGQPATGSLHVAYPDGSSKDVPVTVNVKSNADQYTPEVSTPTVDQNAEVDPNSVVTNKDKLPKGTTYSWTTKPNTETAGQPATGSLHVAYPDGSSKDVPVTVNVKSNADQYTPEVSTPTVDQNAEVDPNSVVTNKDKLPKGTTYSWTTKPNTETAGQPATGSLHVAYPDGSSKDVPVTVNVKSNADQYTPEVSTPTVDQNAEVDPNSVVTNKDKLPKGTTYSWTTKPNTETAGQPATGSLHVAYPDGSSKDVPVTVNVKSNADQYTPEVSTPTVDQNAEVDPNSVVTNKDKLPKGTTYSWTTKPNTETAGQPATGSLHVAYPDGSSKDVPVTVNVKSNADQYTPEVSTPTVDQNAEVDPNSVVTNKDKLPKGTTYSWTTKPNTETAGQPATGSLHVAYPDGSSKDVPVTVNVKSNADQYTPEVSTPTVDQNAEVDPNSVVTNKDKLPKGTTYSWTTKPNTETAGQPATGSLHVAYPDGSSKDVPVTVNVKSNADQYTPEVSTPTVDQNAEVDPNSVVTNKDKLPKGTTYSWTTKPNTETAGQPATGSLHVAYPDGSSKDVPVTVNVKSNADQYTPEVSTPTVDQNAEVDPNSVVTNKDKLPKGTTYSWTTKPNTETAGQPATGSLHVAYPDGSSKDVPVTVNVKSNADQYTPEVSTPTVDQNAEVDPNSVVTNKDKLPKGTTYSWTTKPNTETAGQPATGSLHVAYPDGSSKDVPVTVNVKSNADQYTPEVSTPTVDQNAEVDPNSVVTNKDKLPKGTTYSWTTKPNTETAGQPATGSLHVAYPDGSSKDVPVTVNVKSNADQYTPTPVTTPVKTNENTTLTDEQAKEAIANNADLPTGTTYTWSKQPDTKTYGNTTGEVTVTYPDGTSESVTVPVHVNSDAQNYPIHAGNPVKVDNPANLTEAEKGSVKDAITQANPTAPIDHITVKADGSTTVTFKDGSTTPLASNVLKKTDADKYPLTPGNTVKVADPKHLTNNEKGSVTTAITKANPTAPIKSVAVNDDGSAVVTYQDGSTTTVPANVTKKTDADKYPLTKGNPVKVNDPANLTDAEKGAVKDSLTKANPVAPIKNVTVNPDGSADVTFNDGSTTTVPANVLKKTDADKYPLTKGNPVKVNDPANLTDAEKGAVKDSLTKANPSAPIKNVAVNPDGSADVTFNDGSKTTVPANVLKKTDADKYPLTKGNPVKVNDPANLTDTEKGSVKESLTKANPSAPIKNVAVNHDGSADVTFNDGSTTTVPANVLKKTDADKYPLTKGNPVKVNNPANLTDTEKGEVKDSLTKANPSAPIQTVSVNNDGSATVTFTDGSTTTVPANVIKKTDADRANLKPGNPVKVDNPANLTEPEKGEVKDAITKANPTAPIQTISVNNDGSATVTFTDETTTKLPANVIKKTDADKYPLTKGNPVKVNDPANLTAPEKAAVKESITKANPTAPIKAISVNHDGSATVTFTDDSTTKVPANVIKKTNADQYPLTAGNPVKVNDPAHLTEAEKGEVKDAIKQANPTAPIQSISVNNDGSATVTFNDGSTTTMPANVLKKTDADKYPLTAGNPVKVNDPANLTEAEKGEVKDAIMQANPTAPIKSISVNHDGSATVTFNDGSTTTMPANVLKKTDADKYPLTAGNPVKVNDPANLTEAEKGEVKDAIKQANPTAPIKSISVNNDGRATVTYQDGSTTTLQPNVTKKTDADKHPLVPGNPVKVTDPSHLSVEEKGEVTTAIKQANPTAPIKSVAVNDDGSATVAYQDGSLTTMPANTMKKTDADNYPLVPAKPVTVTDPTHLTATEKGQVSAGIKAANPTAPIKHITVNDDGSAVVTYQDGSTTTVPSNVTPATPTPTPTEADTTTLKPGRAVSVADPSHLTEPEKEQVSAGIKAANPTAPIKSITVNDDGSATVTYQDGSLTTLPANTTKKTDADQYPLVPAKPVTVTDPTHLTATEKGQVSVGIKTANPTAPIKHITVNDDGSAVVTYQDGSTTTVPSNVTKQPATDAERTPVVVPTQKVPVADPSHLSDAEKAMVKDHVAAANPTATVTVADDGTATLTYQDGSTHTIAGAQLVVIKPSITTTADQVTPIVPSGKVPVTDPSHLSDAEKATVKDHVATANQGNFPAGTTLTVADDGTVTITYPDGSVTTLAGSYLVATKPAAGDQTTAVTTDGNRATQNGQATPTAQLGRTSQTKLTTPPAKSQAKTLPQTGNEQGSLLAASGLGMLLLGLLGLGGKRKKED